MTLSGRCTGEILVELNPDFAAGLRFVTSRGSADPLPGDDVDVAREADLLELLALADADHPTLLELRRLQKTS